MTMKTTQPLVPPALGVLLAAGAVLGGCAVGPDYRRPPVPVPAQFRPFAGWVPPAPSDEAPKGDWWTGFHDPLLDELEPQVAVSNQNVRQSYANYQQALAQVGLARSALFPTVGVAGSATRSRVATGAGGGSGPAGAVVNSDALEATAGWTLDLWGSVRRRIEQNTALAQADRALLANATLSEQTLLAATVIDLRYADAQIDLQQRTVAAYRDSLAIVEHQGEAGIAAAPPSAVMAARVALESAAANLIGLGVARAQYAHAIAVLVGRNPEDLDIPHSEALPALPAVPTGIPSTLLQRRPDIAAAERQMAAQNAAVGVAVAAYFPTLSLSAADGFAQSPMNGLLHTANHVWSLGANGAETLFDFGARHAQVEAARAAYEATVAGYRGTVLAAFQGVENDLTALRILADQAQAFERAVHDAGLGTQIALAEFQAGTVDYTAVAQAQVAQLADQQGAIGVAQSRALGAVALIGDLGGGWSAGELEAAAGPN